MGRKTKYYILIAVLLIAVIAIILCIMSVMGRAPSVPQEPQPTPAATSEPPQETQEPEPTDEPEPTEEPEPTPTETVICHTFTITVGEGGAAYPCGVIEVPNREDISILIEAAEGYEIAKATFDGKDVLLLDKISFTYDVPYVTHSHTFTVEFAEKPEATPEPTPETTPELPPEPTPQPTRPVSNSDI